MGSHFCLPSSLECSGEISRKSEICILYKFAQSRCIPQPKIKSEILAQKASETARTIRDAQAQRQETNRIKPQTIGTTGPPSVNDNGSGFPGENIALQHVFYLALALKRKTLKRQQVAKSLGMGGGWVHPYMGYIGISMCGPKG